MVSINVFIKKKVFLRKLVLVYKIIHLCTSYPYWLKYQKGCYCSVFRLLKFFLYATYPIIFRGSQSEKVCFSFIQRVVHYWYAQLIWKSIFAFLPMSSVTETIEGVANCNFRLYFVEANIDENFIPMTFCHRSLLIPLVAT